MDFNAMPFEIGEDGLELICLVLEESRQNGERMTTKLYVYTGTGNSLWIARRLAGIYRYRKKVRLTLHLKPIDELDGA